MNDALVESVREDLDSVGIAAWRAFYIVANGELPPDDWRPPHWADNVNGDNAPK